MESFTKIVKQIKALTIIARNSILDVLQGSECMPLRSLNQRFTKEQLMELKCHIMKWIMIKQLIKTSNILNT